MTGVSQVFRTLYIEKQGAILVLWTDKTLSIRNLGQTFLCPQVLNKPQHRMRSYWKFNENAL